MSDVLLPELLSKIFLLLQPKDVIRCMCASKAWSAVIRDQRFIKAHRDRAMKISSSRIILFPSSSISDWRSSRALSNLLLLPLYDDDEFGTAVETKVTYPYSIVGYSNGLVCIYFGNRHHYGFPDDIVLWNPSIQRFKKVLKLQPSNMSRYEQALYGFGYDSVNDDYKLVQIEEVFVENHGISGFKVNAYSLKHNSWKRIQSMPYHGHRILSNIVFLNGTLCWFVHGLIQTLDLASEEYREFPFPTMYGDHLGLLGGYLCVCRCNFFMSPRHNFWIMKEYGVAESWSLLFSVDPVEVLNLNPNKSYNYSVRPLTLSRDGASVLLRINSTELFWYDLEKKSVKHVGIRDTPGLFRAIVCEGPENLSLLLDGNPVG